MFSDKRRIEVIFISQRCHSASFRMDRFSAFSLIVYKANNSFGCGFVMQEDKIASYENFALALR